MSSSNIQISSTMAKKNRAEQIWISFIMTKIVQNKARTGHSLITTEDKNQSKLDGSPFHSRRPVGGWSWTARFPRQPSLLWLNSKTSRGSGSAWVSELAKGSVEVTGISQQQQRHHREGWRKEVGCAEARQRRNWHGKKGNVGPWCQDRKIGP